MEKVGGLVIAGNGTSRRCTIWSAQRPLVASRPALVATLLADPGNARERQEVLPLKKLRDMAQ